LLLQNITRLWQHKRGIWELALELHRCRFSGRGMYVPHPVTLMRFKLAMERIDQGKGMSPWF
jgi:hypothetical protein